jgi:TolA-binding protein
MTHLLGWAAFQAGDYDKAREANASAIRAASGRAVKAASLYNLGRVAEATGKHGEAAAPLRRVPAAASERHRGQAAERARARRGR